MHPRLKVTLLSLLSVLTLSACSSLPAQLDSQSPNLVTNYQSWDGTLAENTPIRLGGIIAKVDNLTDRTRIEVVNLPISNSGKPDISQEPQGRFVAYVDGFSDPVTLAQGRLITLLGKHSGEELGKVGDFEYLFPVMDKSEYHLWRIEERVVVQNFDSYIYPCRSLHCRSLSYGSKQGRVVQEVK